MSWEWAKNYHIISLFKFKIFQANSYLFYSISAFYLFLLRFIQGRTLLEYCM